MDMNFRHDVSKDRLNHSGRHRLWDGAGGGSFLQAQKHKIGVYVRHDEMPAGLRRPLLHGLVGASVLFTAACGAASGSPGVPPRTTDLIGDCPRLDSQLVQLSRSADPASFASSAGLELSSSGVRAVIELAAGADVPPGHGVRVEARYANSVQVQIPVSELCALSREPVVLSVAPPVRGVPATARP